MVRSISVKSSILSSRVGVILSSSLSIDPQRSRLEQDRAFETCFAQVLKVDDHQFVALGLVN